MAPLYVILHPQGWDDLDPWVDRVSDAEFKRVQAYMEVVEGVGCRRYVLDQYLDRTVDGYTRQQCQDADPDELPCDGCCPASSPSPSPLPAASPSPVSALPAPASEGDVEMQDLPNNTPNARNPPVAVDIRSRSMSEALDASILSQVPQSAAAPSPKPPAPPAAVHTVPGPTSTPSHAAAPSQYRRAALRQQAATVQWGLDREFLEQEARRWLNQCYVCTVAGRDGDHELYNCRHPDSQTAKQWMVQLRSQIDYAPFLCCFRCGMPQSVCQGWQAGQQCPWRGALISTIAGMLYGPHGAEVQSAWQRHLAGRMVEPRVVYAQKARRQVDAHVVDVQEVTSVAAFLGQATADGQGVEMQAVFCWLRRVCQESE